MQVKNLKDLVLKNQLYLSVVIAVCLVVIGVFFGWYNDRVMPINNNPIATYKLEPNNPLKFMANWDSNNYITIANSGYISVDMTNFFPLYPILINLLTHITGSALDSALIISWVCLIGIVYFYMSIIDFLFKDKGKSAVRAVLLLLLFPSAVFFLAAYTESLFAFLALASVYYTLTKRYWRAVVFAIPLTATHVTGLFVLALIGLIMLEDKVKITKIVAILAASSLGLLGFMFYLLEKFNKPFAFITSQESHGWLSSKYSNLVSSADVISAIIIVLVILSAIYWWNKRRSLSLYALIFLLIPIVGQQFGGFDRYALMAFSVPLMLYGYTRKRPNLYAVTLVLTTVMWTYFLLQYSGGYIGG